MRAKDPNKTINSDLIIWVCVFCLINSIFNITPIYVDNLEINYL